MGYGRTNRWSAGASGPGERGQGARGDAEERAPGRDYSGTGPRGYTRPDRSIREELCERLTHDPDVDPSDVEVMVVDGEVLLTGTVETREVKRRIEDVAHDVIGVRDVDNRLRIGLTLHAPHPDTSADDFNMPWPRRR